MFTKRQRRSRRSYRRMRYIPVGGTVVHNINLTTGYVRGLCAGDKCPWHGRK